MNFLRSVPSRLAVTTLLLLLAACAPRSSTTTVTPAPSPQPEPEPTISAEPLPDPARLPTVGLLLPLTGDAGEVGEDMLAAAQMALFEAGASDLVLLPRDTGGSPDRAARAAREVMNDGATLILGPLLSSSAQSVGAVARPQNVSVLSFSNNPNVAGNGVWVMGYRPEEQVARVLDYAIDRQIGDLAALLPENEFGTLAATSWRDVVGRLKPSDLGALSLYPADGGDVAPVVERLIDEHARPLGVATVDQGTEGAIDGLLLVDSGVRLEQLSALMDFYGLDRGATRFLSTELWLADPTVTGEPIYSGSWVAGVPPDTRRRFERQFAQAFDRTPHPLAALAYDATLLSVLVANSDPSFPMALLTDPAGFRGHAGIFRLMPQGTTEHGLAVMELGFGGARVIDEPPTAFAPEPVN